MSNQKSTPTNFVATVYGNLTPLNNSAFSKARLKIFYKGLNRNGSYITDEIAEKLLSTLPGTPVVGNFSGEKDDFEAHMPWSPEELKAYGFVPQDMNFKWEMSLDPDGVYRTYACTDVVLWTGRYPIASKIVGKCHSMELNPNTIEGEWVEHDDEFCFEFTNAEFIGLCVLGDEYEPCFEGSSFYELHKDNQSINIKADLKEMFNLYSQIENGADENPTGGQEMEEKKKDELESTVTPEEELEKEVPAQEEEVEQEEQEQEEEKEEGAASEEEEQSEEEQESEEESEEEEKEDEGSEEEGSDEEQVDLNAQLAEKDEEIANLKAELESLQSYKAQKIKEEKENVLNSYSNKLTEEEVNNFKAKMDSYESAVELKKDIALCILDKEVATEEEDETTQFSLVNSQKSKLTGAASIVAQYVNK